MSAPHLTETTLAAEVAFKVLARETPDTREAPDARETPDAPGARELALVERYRRHPGRGGCGVGAIADLNGASHELVRLALEGLRCMEHRGGALDDTGDGAGLIMATPRAFFERFIAPGKRLPAGHGLGVGVVFFPVGERSNIPFWQHEIDATLRRHGILPLGWRAVPVDERAVGRTAHESRREVWQCIVGEGMVFGDEFARAMFRAKAVIERSFRDLYLPSFSPKTLVYKALATGEQLSRYYRDLTDPELTTDLVVYHRRYSTNTFSNWYLAQPFRTLGHNGEINTIKANRNAVRNLEAELHWPGVLMPQGSDSADVDRVVEMFRSHGVSLPETLMRMMPMASADLVGPAEEIDPIRRFFRGVQRALGTLGAWEGPAALVSTDGDTLVTMLDRMGLRPLRYVLTNTGRVFVGSELGAHVVPDAEIARTGQLDPGEALSVDVRSREVLEPAALLRRVVERTRINFPDLAESGLQTPPARIEAAPGLPRLDPAVSSLFGITPSRARLAKALAETGKEPVTSMGNDRPLAVFSAQRPPLYKYCKQIVAVVTNPPLDPLREGSAFDLTTHLGVSPVVHEDAPNYDIVAQYRLAGPILDATQTAFIKAAAEPGQPKCVTLEAVFFDPLPAGEDSNALERTLSREAAGRGGRVIAERIAELTRQAVSLVKRGEASVLCLSDASAARPRAQDAPRPLPLPMLLLVGQVHNALIAEGLRRHTGLLVECGDVLEGHDAAMLIATGATAICPYLLLQLGASELKLAPDKPFAPVKNLVKSLEDAVRRIMSKMGICTLDGYRGSCLYEVVGLSAALVDYYLPGIQSRIGGLELADLYDDIRHRAALGSKPVMELDANVYRKEVWQQLQETARGNIGAWEKFTTLLHETPPVYLRDLLSFRETAGRAAPLSAVVSEAEIVATTFRGAAMSHGALHRIAHRAIAAAFNRLGAASNCGEGGEDARRDRGGEWAESRSRIRQVGSGRFGVEARYLVHGDELQIKIGQGAKPGEGGHLPAEKVTEEIARIRRTRPGVALISPPPHHDIYSIEDLAQVIHNLRQINPRARISVKIPGVTDIGTIAVGVAKAGADVIDVSGMEGGTGAAAASSIEHAGLPLERALSEVHQALVINGLRQQVLVRCDGGLKTGFDVAIVLALGADEVSLGTALMIAEQCIFCHGCAAGNCPAGITTQSNLVARRLMTDKKGRGQDVALPDDETLRFRDALEGVTRYLLALAGEVRGLLARLGLRRPQELVGRVDLLQQLVTGNARTDLVDLSELLLDPSGRPGTAKGGRGPTLPVDPTNLLNARLVGDARYATQRRALHPGASGPVCLTYDITTGDRATGATLAGALTLGDIVCPAEGLVVRLRGYAGQALGFGLVEGLTLDLTGFANDMVGEAMSGGRVVVRLPAALTERDTQSAIGNAAAYGCTGGTLLVEGRAGQRFGVRMSGGLLMSEGTGKYAFEYMTGGVGVVLGSTGPVVASGMTGGVVYLLDEDGYAAKRLHPDARAVPLDAMDAESLRGHVTEFARETGSPKAARLLAEWPETCARIVKVVSAMG